jgi:putative effector of murein hydrolase LrgA (UPF0299 family)
MTEEEFFEMVGYGARKMCWLSAWAFAGVAILWLLILVFTGHLIGALALFIPLSFIGGCLHWVYKRHKDTWPKNR